MLELFESALATWRLTHMLMWERGPFDIITKLRELTGIEHDEDKEPSSWPDNHVLGCFLCLSIWTALTPRSTARFVLAVSGLAIVFNRGYEWLDRA